MSRHNPLTVEGLCCDVQIIKAVDNGRNRALHRWLPSSAAAAVGHLIVTGAQTNFCVRNTVHAAFERGYDVTVVGDGHTTSDESWNNYELKADTIIDDFNLGFTQYDLPGRHVRLIHSTDALA